MDNYSESSKTPFPAVMAASAAVTASDTAKANQRMAGTGHQLPVTRSFSKGETPKRGTSTPK